MIRTTLRGRMSSISEFHRRNTLYVQLLNHFERVIPVDCQFWLQRADLEADLRKVADLNGFLRDSYFYQYVIRYTSLQSVMLR
jgi:hypothetical protein